MTSLSRALKPHDSESLMAVLCTDDTDPLLSSASGGVDQYQWRHQWDQ